MISKIEMSKVASFHALTALETDKRINLIYGLNGTGKSTISDFLYKPDEARYAHCRTEFVSQVPVVVYNQSFIHDHFFEEDSLKGIFSLSKENKAAKEKVLRAQQKLAKLHESLTSKSDQIRDTRKERNTKKIKCSNDIWQIKTSYCGGDRVLEYCLDSLRGQKEKLFSHVLALPKPAQEPGDTIPQLKKDVEALRDASAKPLDKLPEIDCNTHSVESHLILEKVIVGNADSVVAELIDELHNSDWVKEGLSYLPDEFEEEGSPCPFCQERTLTANLVKNIEEYFDDAYEEDLSTLRGLGEILKTARETMPDISQYLDHELLTDSRVKFEKLYGDCIQVFETNIRKIEEKLQTPSILVELKDLKPRIDALNEAIHESNDRILKHNAWVLDREASLTEIKTKFWQLMRWQYDQTLSRYVTDGNELDSKITFLIKEKEQIETEAEKQDSIITEAQRETINIDEAVDNINARLIDLGIDDFSIRKYSDSLYRIVRQGQVNDVFHTLSEGERMIISFLYFCELALGKLSAEDTGSHRIAVIDDPISSLSHVYIFNVGQLIRRLFFQSDRFRQVFILTHSLYFFYEMTDPNHDRRKKNQKLFRMLKNSSGSLIKEMKYEEIQNDYQAYWSIVNDSEQPPALLANCMRNIIEYFFNFVKRRDLNNVFQMPELQDTKYQAFCRYVNRESHSLGQNILDLKEFDYSAFREGLHLVFEKAGYGDHCREMSKV